MLLPPTPRGLGEAATLLEPPILGGDGGWRFAEVQGAMLVPQPLPVQPEGLGAWEAPKLHLCEDDEALLGQILGVRVHPALGDGDGFEVPVGALPLRGADGASWRAALARQLGLSCLGPGVGFLCLSVQRLTQRVAHEGFVSDLAGRFDRERHMSREGKQAMARLAGFVPTLGPLPPQRRLQDARDSLDFAQRFGSHFVSALRRGDRLLQVFSFEGQALDELIVRWRERVGEGPAEGWAALDWAAQASPKSRLEAGHILSVAGDPELPALLSAGHFQDDHQTQTSSLFLPFQRGITRVQEALGPLRAVATIGLELTPISRCIERYRSLGVALVTRGALRLTCGPDLRCQLPRSPLDPAPAPAERALTQAVGALLPTWSPPDRLAPGVICAREATLRGPGHTRLVEGTTWLVAQRVVGARDCQELHTIFWEAGASLRLVVGAMQGAVVLNGPDGEEIVLDGLRMGLDADRRVIVSGGVTELDEAERAGLWPTLGGAVAAALAPREVLGARVRHDEALAAWLAPLVPADKDDLRRLLRGIALGAADAGGTPLRSPQETLYALARSAGAFSAKPDPERLRSHNALRVAALRVEEALARDRLRAARATLNAEVAALRPEITDPDLALALEFIAFPIESAAELPRHLRLALRPGGLRPQPPPAWLVQQVDLPLAARELLGALVAADPDAPPGWLDQDAPRPWPRVPAEAFDRHLHHMREALGAGLGHAHQPLLRALAAWLAPLRALCQTRRCLAMCGLAAARLALLTRAHEEGAEHAMIQAVWTWTLAEALADQNAALQHSGQQTEPHVPGRPLALAQALAFQARHGGLGA